MLRTPPLPLPEGEGFFTPLSFGEGAGGEVEQTGVLGICLRNISYLLTST